MKNIWILLLAWGGIACNSSTEKDTQNSILNRISISKIAELYQQNGVEGCLILYDLNKEESLVYNEERTKIPLSPASTYKIPHSLIALETKAVANRYQVIPWDGQERSIPQWNQDHHLESALKASAVWFYQEVARRVGQERMQAWVDTMQYGNQNISGGIDQFWLRGGLRITAWEQIEFLKKFYKEEFPFTPKNYQTVKEIMITKKLDSYAIHGKTGWGLEGLNDKGVGWFVGYAETEKDLILFANNIDITKDEDAKARIEIVYQVLKELEIMSLLD